MKARELAEEWRNREQGMGKKTETFTRYDTADYLSGVEDVAAYLEANALGLRLHFESVS